MSVEEKTTLEEITQENRRLKAQLAAVGVPGEPPDKQFAALAQSVQHLTEMVEAMQISNLSLKEENTEQEEYESHPIGLCQEIDCGVCVSQAQELIEAGRQQLSDEIDESLILAGGEPMRTRIAQLVQQGTTLRQQRAQVVELIA